ncbi:MAG: type II toxin-antitoxin system RelE/ParE family toxin [Sphingomonadales bacterium]
MIVTISARAQSDLEAIGDYIARDNPKRAVSFVRELRKKCLDLSALPHGFPIVPQYETLGIRKRTHGNYLIFYHVDTDRITVLHIVNGAMDYSDRLL